VVCGIFFHVLPGSTSFRSVVCSILVHMDGMQGEDILVYMENILPFRNHMDAYHFHRLLYNNDGYEELFYKDPLSFGPSLL
jgi:hypothetical protein